MEMPVLLRNLDPKGRVLAVIRLNNVIAEIAKASFVPEDIVEEILAELLGRGSSLRSDKPPSWSSVIARTNARLATRPWVERPELILTERERTLRLREEYAKGREFRRWPPDLTATIEP